MGCTPNWLKQVCIALHLVTAITYRLCSSPLQTDSVSFVLSGIKSNGEDEVDQFLALGKDMLFTDVDSAFYYGEMAYKLARDAGYTRGSAKALSLKGTCELVKGDLEQAIQYLKLTRVLWEELKDTTELAKTLNNLGIAYSHQGEYDSAIFFQSESIVLLERLGDSTQLAGMYSNLGVSYRNKNNYKTALKQYERALEIQLNMRDQVDNREDIAYIYINIGSMYFTLEEFESSLEYFQNAEQIAREIDNKLLLASIYVNLGASNYRLSQYESALINLDAGIEIAKEISHSQSIYRGYTYQGRTYEALNRYSVALDAYLQSLAIQTENDNIGADTYVDLGRINYKLYIFNKAEQYAKLGYDTAIENGKIETAADAAKLLSQVYEAELNPTLALKYEREHSVLKDSALRLVADREYTEMRTLFEADQQEKELKLRDAELARQVALIEKRKIQSRNMWYILGSVFVLFVSSVFYLYKMKTTNQKLLTLNKRIKEHRDLLNQQAQELWLKNKDLKSFSLALGHDLKQPLTTISGFTDLIIKAFDQSKDPRGKMYANYLQQGIDRMNFRIEQLVEFFRTGENVSMANPVDLNKVISQVLQDLHSSISTTKTDLTIGDLPTLKGDYGLITQLFQNLISNSIKYRKEGTSPEIVVESTVDDRHHIISVSDNGQGIKDIYIDSIFKLFDRGERREGSDGSGIGLATCKRIVELHGGKIEVKSQYGEGTTFFIHLPFTNT